MITHPSTTRVLAPAAGSLSLGQYLAYAAPTMMVTFLWSPMGILQGIYAKYYGVALTTIATVLLIARLFDAVTDPLIGYWSDRVQAKRGTRKPFVLVGGLLFIVSSYFLYVPVDPGNVGASTVVSPAYFLIWFLLFYLAYTLMEIPHMAWAAELAPGSQDKNKIYSLRYMSSHVAMLCFYLLPFLPFFASRDFTPQTLQWAAITGCVLMLPALYLCLTRVPTGPRVAPAQVSQVKAASFWALRHEIMANKPLLLFLTGFSLFMSGAGMFFTLIFIVVDSYLMLGHHYALVALLGIVASILILPLWYWLASRVGKQFVLGASALLYGLGALLVSFLVPGQAGLLSLGLVMFLVYVSGISAIAPALLGEIIDYNTWKFGSDRSATYFALYTFALKATMAVGGSVGLGIAGWYGFDPADAMHSEVAVFGLRLAVSWLPAGLMVLSVGLISHIPMNACRHRIIRRRLDARIEREARDQEPGEATASALPTLTPSPS